MMLAGLSYTSELRSVVKEVYGLIESSDFSDSVSDKSKDQHLPPSLPSPNVTTKAYKKSTVWRALHPSLSINDSKKILKDISMPTSKGEGTSSSDEFHTKALSLCAIAAVRVVLCDDAMSSAIHEKNIILNRFEKAISTTKLVFVTPHSQNKLPQEKNDAAKFQKRIKHLRLQQDATKYNRLVSNLDKTVADDVTVKSMSYAASVGLNMIVAPLSFGCFVYFFVGHLLFPFPSDTENLTAGLLMQLEESLFIKRIMIGVIGGVIMLFIEMVLFVIRAHEFDAHTTKKAKKKAKNITPFGG
mmetsp:Transcript_62221/g.72765  ORF Transcript_62221/g.72765 Transcript_62221/m.72765 type:complete len:300 (+) Transcript_62221:99-998(+)